MSYGMKLYAKTGLDEQKYGDSQKVSPNLWPYGIQEGLGQGKEQSWQERFGVHLEESSPGKNKAWGIQEMEDS